MKCFNKQPYWVSRRIKIEVFSRTHVYTSQLVSSTLDTNMIRVCAVSSIILCPCLSANLYTTVKGCFFSVCEWRSYLQNHDVCDRHSPHRILDTFLKKRSPSLITALCPTLVPLTLFCLCGTQLWSCETEYNGRIKGLLSGQCFWWNLKTEAQEG